MNKELLILKRKKANERVKRRKIKTIAIKAVVKNGLIKPLETIDLPEDEEIVIYIPEKKEAEEYSEWTDEEWQMMKHQEYLCQVTGDINKHYEREVIRIG